MLALGACGALTDPFSWVMGMSIVWCCLSSTGQGWVSGTQQWVLFGELSPCPSWGWWVRGGCSQAAPSLPAWPRTTGPAAAPAPGSRNSSRPQKRSLSSLGRRFAVRRAGAAELSGAAQSRGSAVWRQGMGLLCRCSMELWSG